MDHALRVRIGQRPGDLAQHPRRLGRRQRPALAHPLRERVALHERHREEDELARLLHREDRNDVGVGQLGRRAGFAQEPLSQAAVARLGGRQQFDRHRAVESHFAGEVDHPHPAAADLALEGIAAGEGRLEVEEETVDLLNHGAAPLRPPAGPRAAVRSARRSRGRW